jgi:acyl carrier protein
VGCCVLDVTAEGEAVAAARPGTVPIGHPLDGATATLVDAHGQPVPVGAPGELWIGGAGVSRGYLQRPEEDAARFGEDPLRPGGRVYRTGDLARVLPGGAIEFLGRVDDQVKIRGYRVEPKEIEHVLAEHPAVRQVAVVAREDTPGDRRLVAYLVADGKPTAEALRSRVLDRLPEYMAPAGFVVLDKLPLTASGKLDRQALPAPDLTSDMTRPYVAPRDALEEQMAAIWADVLGLERIGIHDDFFEVGGHSLLAVQIVARVRDTLGAELPLHSLFLAPTVAQLTDEARAQAPADDAALDDLLAGLSDDEVAQLLAEE